MAKKTTAKKTINYRRCLIAPYQGQTLKQLLTLALQQHPKPGDRYEPLNSQSSELRCIGASYEIADCLCGFMTTFERGASQPVISDDTNAASLRLSSLAPPPPKKGDAPQQYVPGVLYFVVHGNHVAFISTHAIRSNALEMHLNWLLKSKTTVLDSTVAFSLSDEAQKATKEKIKKSHVKSISLGQPLMTETQLQVTDQSASKDLVASGKGKKSTKSSFKPDGPMLGLIKSFFDDEKDFEKLGLDELFDGNLEVWIEIRYPKFKRYHPDDAIKLMDTLGVALRDVEGDQVSLELKDGTKVSGKDLKITASLDVDLQQNNLPDERKLFEQMVHWLLTQIKNGAIDP